MYREKVIKGLKCCQISMDNDEPFALCLSECPYSENGILVQDCRSILCADAIALLKEQQQQIWELQDQVEYLIDKQKAQKFFVDESGKITPLPIVFPNCPLKEYEAVVRCKDCKHYDKDMIYCNKFGIQNIDNDWFCADGERSD